MKVKKRTKKIRRGWKVAGITALIAAVLLVGVLLLFHVQEIKVSGNQYLTDQEVAEWVQKDKYTTNALYLWAKFKFGAPELHPNMETLEVKLMNPWTISVRVYEKKMVGFVFDRNNMVYFDREGNVLEISMEFRDGVPLIEGLTANTAKLYQSLPVADEKVFDAILEVTRMMEKYELSADRIVCIDSELYLYFGSICVRVGAENLENRIIQIPPILKKLEGKKGLLHLENYQDSNSMINFDENVWPDETAADENKDDSATEDGTQDEGAGNAEESGEEENQTDLQEENQGNP